MSYAKPLDNLTVTSGYRTARRPTHNGTDYRARVGTPLYAAMDGVVATGSGHRSAGTWVEIRNGNNVVGYSHMSSRTVRAGQRVKAGDRIGATGNTGNTSGPHLHFYVKVNGSFVNPHTWIAQMTRPKPAPKPSAPARAKTTSDWLTRAQIRKLQQGLRTKFPAYRRKVNVKRGQLIAVDGIDGPQTRAWVKEFQRRTGLKSDGIAGPATKAKAAQYGIHY